MSRMGARHGSMPSLPNLGGGAHLNTSRRRILNDYVSKPLLQRGTLANNGLSAMNLSPNRNLIPNISTVNHDNL